MTINYCASECYSGNDWTLDAYDGVTEFTPVDVGIDYDIGRDADGGQFLITIDAD